MAFIASTDKLLPSKVAVGIREGVSCFGSERCRVGEREADREVIWW